MAAIADGIDFMFGCLHGKTSTTSGIVADRSGQKGAIGLCYLFFAGAWFQILGNFSDSDFSAIATAGSLVQCLGFLLLNVKVSGTKSVAGLSSKMLVMYLLHFCFRLTSTSMKNGYIPVDSSGDYMYQLLDFGSLVLVTNLLFRSHRCFVYTYQEDHDSLPIKPIVAGCIVLGILFHGSFNKCFVFDSLWQISANLEAFVLLPQLWMMAKIGGKVDTVTCHFIVCMVVSSVMTFTFWWWTSVELTKYGWCYAYPILLGGQILKLLSGADFMFYWAQAWLNGDEVILPEMVEM